MREIIKKITSLGVLTGLFFLMTSCSIKDTKPNGQHEEIKKALEAAQKEERERKAAGDLNTDGYFISPDGKIVVPFFPNLIKTKE
jgi:hypothetical protein